MKSSLIDVSTWNGNIDWNSVYQSGVKFAMIRSSFGVENPNQVDNKFVRNITNAQRAGVKCGVYHYSYAQSVSAAKQEAEFCLKTIKGYKLDLPVAFDIEDSSQTHLGKDTLTNIVIAFCDKIKSAGYRPMLYCNPNWLCNYLHKDKLINKYDIWLANWGVSAPSYDCAIWQYSETGKVSGISGSVDVNWLFKDYTGGQSDTTSNTVKVINKTSYIRSQAYVDDYGGSSVRLATLKVGTAITWLSDDGYGWSKVKRGNVTGYIQNSRISKTGVSTWRQATITGIPVYDKPCGAVVKIVPNSSKLIVTSKIVSGKYAGWTCILLDSKDRFVKSSCLEVGSKRTK